MKRESRLPFAALAAFAWLSAFVPMASDVPLRGGALVATLSVLLGAAFATAALAPSPSDARPAPAALRGALVALVSAMGFYVALIAGVHGAGPALVGAAFVVFGLGFVHGGALFGAGLRGVRLSWRRPPPAALVAALGVVLAAPTLGSFGLLDPWETHYAEVAREMLARDDALSTFWSHEGWFRSKPVLDFWIQALALRLSFASVDPGHVLDGAHGALAAPEWAVRLPSFVIALVGSAVLVAGVARTHGRRAAVLGGVVLWTCPQWFFLSHQSITDMPLVGALSAALGVLLLALATPKDAFVRGYRIGRGRLAFTFDARRLVLFWVLVLVVPQVLYLVSRNVEVRVVAAPMGLRVHGDTFFFGSPGNAELPGQVHAAMQRPVHRTLQPALVGLYTAAVLAFVLTALRREERLRPTLVALAWILAAVAAMGKGPAGIVFPVGAALAHALAARRADLVKDARPFVAAALVGAIVLPWYVALYGRHGRPFLDELVFRNMIGRTLDHLHDTNQGDDTSVLYYVWQLGYAMFPWIGLVPAALARVMRADARERRGAAPVLLGASALFTFALVASMRTKFHHYVFPAVPPLALLVGLVLDDLLRPAASSPAPWAPLAVAGAALVTIVGYDFLTPPGVGGVEGQGRLLQLFSYLYRRPWPATVDLRPLLASFTAVAALAVAALAIPTLRRAGSGALVAVALAFATFGLFVYLPRVAPHSGQRELVARFVRERPSADEPLVAYQMNWKGEAFYTGNHVAAFVSSGAPFVTWVRDRILAGHRTLWVVTQYDRIAALRVELSASAVGAQHHLEELEPLESVAVNNKFALLRVRFE